jgi:hypothetical protein
MRHQSDNLCCRWCSDTPIAKMSGPKLLLHMGSHILHDPQLKDADSPCGLCLSTGQLCKICLVKRAKKGIQIDLVNSHCPNLKKISLAKASKFTKQSPCTNVPMQCPLCPKVSDAVCKYNLCTHIWKDHPSANVINYGNLYTISPKESIPMKGIYKRYSKLKKSKATTPGYAISEGHSSHFAMRYASVI